MTDRVLDFSLEPAHLSVRNGLLIVKRETTEASSVPFSEIAVIVAAHPQVTFTQAVLSELAEADGTLITCNRKFLPASMLMPIQGHHAQGERFRMQAALRKPIQKRLWQSVVRAKIIAQAQVLREAIGSDGGLLALVHRVKSGDPQNTEARASRRYWSLLFSGMGGSSFRRSDDTDSRNAALDYGYAILRALTARAVSAAGLHPTFGIHHQNKFNNYSLADDLMEPFRPCVDRAVVLASSKGAGLTHPLDSTLKRLLIDSVLARVQVAGEERTLPDILRRLAQSLAAVVTGESRKLWLPRWHFLS